MVMTLRRREFLRQNRTRPDWAAWLAALAIGSMLGVRPASAQNAPVPVAPATTAPAGRATTAEEPNPPKEPSLPDGVQLVKFRVPDGVKLEILAPAPETLPDPERADGAVGLKNGVGYRLKLSNLPDRAGKVLFPVVEIVGHLHRPNDIDPYRFPVRIAFGEDDFDDVIDHGRLVTEVVYLEDPELAAPIALPKGEMPIVTLSAIEDPLKVATALGRVMAIVRIGGRTPTTDELSREAGVEVDARPCPYSSSEGTPCGLPCGPGRAPAPNGSRASMPRDEYVCDGGDRGEIMHFESGGILRGMDPRDSAVQFNDGKRVRVLPTNTVCMYAPRFAATKASFGPSLHYLIEPVRGAEQVNALKTAALRQNPRRFIKNEPAVIARHRLRPSNMKGRVYAGINMEMRVLAGYGGSVAPKSNAEAIKAQLIKDRIKVSTHKTALKAIGIKTAESAVATGIVEGSAEKVSIWPVQDVNGVEKPPKRPGLAIIKRVSTGVAEPGDVVSYVIEYRNMGNTPINDVSIIDSLTARLEYESGSAIGPEGTVFTAGENVAGATELRWDLPGALAPGATGYVSFKVKVR